MVDRSNAANNAFREKVTQSGLPVTAGEVAAMITTLVWMVGVVMIVPATTDVDGLRTVVLVIAIVLPVLMVAIALLAARALRVVRGESQRLQTALDAMRQTYVPDRQARGTANERTPHDKLPAHLVAAPQPPPPAQRREDQPRLALGTTVDDLTPPISKPDLVRALNFPDTEADEVGFAALRRALKDRTAKHLIQASQDVLTLMSQDGIYMDDLEPERAQFDIWRRFAGGERGTAVATLGGIRDPATLDVTTARMREDTIFRDAAHHFLRKYDQMLVSFETDASDADLAALAETRTSRAFMLLGRVSGAFG